MQSPAVEAYIAEHGFAHFETAVQRYGYHRVCFQIEYHAAYHFPKMSKQLLEARYKVQTEHQRVLAVREIVGEQLTPKQERKLKRDEANFSLMFKRIFKIR